MSRRKKKKKSIPYSEVHLNMMPFIDAFSVLITFLLMTAAFVTIGIVEVQIPFLTNAPPPKEKPTRSLSVNVDMEKEKIEVVSSYTMAPVNEQKETFTTDKTGIDKMHKHLVTLRRNNLETDKVTFFTDDEVLWKDMSTVLDAIKLRQDGDPVFKTQEKPDPTKPKDPNDYSDLFLYPKIVMGSVML